MSAAYLLPVTDDVLDALASATSRDDVVAAITQFGVISEVVAGTTLEPDTRERVKHLHGMGWSLGKIARTLNAEGITAKSGGKWYPQTVRAITHA